MTSETNQWVHSHRGRNFLTQFGASYVSKVPTQTLPGTTRKPTLAQQLYKFSRGRAKICIS